MNPGTVHRVPKLRVRIHYASISGQPLCGADLSPNNKATTATRDLTCGKCRRSIGLTPQNRGRQTERR